MDVQTGLMIMAFIVVCLAYIIIANDIDKRR